MFKLKLELETADKNLLERVLRALEPSRFTVEGGIWMFILPNNQPPTPFSISPIGTVRDEEGEVVTTPVTEELTSTNPSVVATEFAEGSSASNPRAGQLAYGTSGIATVTYVAKTVYKGQDVILKTIAKNFTITTGAPVSTEGGDFTLEGVTEEPEV